MSSEKLKIELEILHDYDLCLSDNTIYLGSQTGNLDGEESGTDYAMAERIIKNLHILDREEQEHGIVIKMNNLGGDVHHGMAIYDAIANCKNEITIISYGHVMSMGSYIFQAANHRVMSPSSRMMLHAIQVSGLEGNYYKILEELKEIEFLQEIMNDVYLDRIKEVKPKYQKRHLIKKITEDWFCSPQEAIEMGLCDSILL